MGCVSSRPEFPNDVHPNVFTVTTVARPTNGINGDVRPSSSSSRESGASHLEVTNNELILHRRGHDAVHWPLQFIRRYGFENHLFSFESGRRCESGPGIFTFRCRRARELFALVQSNVQEARTPPPTGTSSTTSTIPGRVRSGSATSQTNQFAFPLPPNSGNSFGRRSLNDYLAPEQPPSLRTTTSLTTAAANGNQRISTPSPNSNSILPSPRSGAGSETNVGLFDDIDSGQVFVEVTPLRNSLVAAPRQRLLNDERRQRLSSARSQTSSAASDHSLSVTFGQQPSRSRPISFEFVLSPQDGDNNAFVSPQQSNASPSASPPSFAYYVNVEPPTSIGEGPPKKIDSQRHLSAERHSNGTWRPPARSQSLGSPNTADHKQYFDSSSSNADGAYVNITQSNSPSVSPQECRRKEDSIVEPNKIILDYVTLDVGGGGGGGGTSPSNYYNRPHYHHRRQSSHTTSVTSGENASGRNSGLFASSLTSVAESGSTSVLKNGQSDESSTATTTTTTSNYARIDCTRTKALRETAAAAHMQRHSTSCSASSSEATIGAGDQTTLSARRTRHDSVMTSTSSGHKAL